MVLFLVFILSSSIFTANGKQCTVLLSSHFSNCTNRQGELADFQNDELNRVYSFNTSLISGGECKYENVCRKIFHVARVSGQSFSAKTLVQLSYMLAQCCGECAKYYRTDITMNELIANTSLVENYDLLYPVVGRLSIDDMFGYHFIPVFNLPGAFYLTLGKSEKELSEDMIMACLNMWPLFVMCVILSLLAGFVAWALEMRKNKQEFPANFFLGMYEGFWWSFISMTTVGYGDRVPKSVFGRIFSVIWILIGITIVGIFTANLTTELMNSTATTSNGDAKHRLNGKTIGILKLRLHDATIVAQHGGIAHEISYNSTINGMTDLFEMLNKKELDGIVMSRSTYFYFFRVINENEKYYHIQEKITNMKVIREELSFTDKEIVVGAIVKNKTNFTYFKRYFESNWFQIQSCYEYSLNYKDKQFDALQRPSIEGLFYPFFYWSIGILGVLFVFGTFFEIFKHFFKNTDRPKVVQVSSLNQ